MAIMIAVVPTMVVAAIAGCVAGGGLRASATWLQLTVLIVLGHITLDDFVQFAPIKPHASAFRAIVNLDALALAHNEIGPAKRAKEPVTSLAWSLRRF
ncbi:hypothetical protein BFN67_16890 [Pseudaminobacter manganicus]|uniref:Uncharacterized protein n=1 Tax=Manganibacter manganicus TaxID=1873176 RepID=A0A1V8RR90_9HYPH|nr:hypothetical protein BFN67_16890 [Pseudaminobacter manganicus]